MQPRRKLHAACGYTHSAIDLMGQLHRDIGPNALAAAREIRIFTPAYIMPAVVKTDPPSSPNNARFHINYCAALAAKGVDVILPDHSLRFTEWFTPDVADQMARIKVVLGEGFVHYSECRIEVDLADSTTVTVEGRTPRGSPENPLGEDGVKAKFASLVGDRMTPAARERYFARIMGIENEASVEWLLEPFCG